ncbi:sulfurtransferase TusA family protein [Hyphomicrobium sp.]|uniref:sulfurtransferase TusA family protein n=1 Tax=Hyphomicrobium sp. TaxID=82 RepID=UPI003F6EB52C
MPNVAADQVLDTLGLRCPLPVLKARKALSALAPGRVLKVLANDPAAAEDFAALCQVTGHRLVAQTQDGNVHHFLIESAGPPAEPGG